MKNTFQKAVQDQILRDNNKARSSSTTQTSKRPTNTTITKRRFHTAVITLCTKKEPGSSLFDSVYREQVQKMDRDYGKTMDEFRPKSKANPGKH
jgi:hypothetical protein